MLNPAMIFRYDGIIKLELGGIFRKDILGPLIPTYPHPSNLSRSTYGPQ